MGSEWYSEERDGMQVKSEEKLFPKLNRNCNLHADFH